MKRYVRLLGYRHQFKRFFSSTPATLSTVGSSSSSICIPSETSKDGKTWSLKMPLPSLGGLNEITLPTSDTSINALTNAMKQKDSSIKTISVTSKDGTTYASSTELATLLGGDFTININGSDLCLQTFRNTSKPNEAQNTTDMNGFQRLRLSLQTDANASSNNDSSSPYYITMNDFISRCRDRIYGAKSKAEALEWLHALKRQNFVMHFKSPELSDVIFINPLGSSVERLVHSALDVKHFEVSTELAAKDTELLLLESNLRDARTIDADITRRSERHLSLYKWIVFIGLNAQFAGMAYLVWDVQSWDVMEPVTYFLGFTAMIGTSLYHSLTRKDFSCTNVWNRMLQNRIKKAYESRKIPQTLIQDLENEIQEVRQEVSLLKMKVKIS